MTVRYKMPSLVELPRNGVMSHLQLCACLNWPSRQLLYLWRRQKDFPAAYRDGHSYWFVTNSVEKWLRDQNIRVKNRTNSLRDNDFIALYQFSKAIYERTPEPLIPNELIYAAKDAMQKCCRYKDEVATFYDMVYIAREFLNHWNDYYHGRLVVKNLRMNPPQ